MTGNTLTDTSDGWIVEAARLFKSVHPVTPNLGAQALGAVTAEAPPSPFSSEEVHSLADIRI